MGFLEKFFTSQTLSQIYKNHKKVITTTNIIIKSIKKASKSIKKHQKKHQKASKYYFEYRI